MPVSVDEAGRLSLSLIRLMKLLKSIRTHAPQAHPAIETAAYPIMFTLVDGPMRVSALADAVHSDVSTVSRQSSALVEHGLLGKVQDPGDGRAWMLSLTDEGDGLVRQLKQQRAQWFSGLLQGWDHDDVATFTQGVERLIASCEQERRRLTGATEASRPAAAGATDIPTDATTDLAEELAP